MRYQGLSGAEKTEHGVIVQCIEKSLPLPWLCAKPSTRTQLQARTNPLGPSTVPVCSTSTLGGRGVKIEGEKREYRDIRLSVGKAEHCNNSNHNVKESSHQARNRAWIFFKTSCPRRNVVRSPGFEPGSSAWEADVLAMLDYDRSIQKILQRRDD
jgi:hypothetical protein